MDFQKLAKAYLRFSRRDRTGLVFLVFLILIIYFLPMLFPAPTALPPSLLALDTLSLEPVLAANAPPSNYSTPSAPAHRTSLFSFDPNTLSAEGWRALGLPERVIHTITNYRNKGGRFRQPSDLQKIWGMPGSFYERVRDSVRIPEGQSGERVWGNREYNAGAENRPARAAREVDINSADTAAFIALPGIGSRLAGRIVAFRERLGGFVSAEQVGEVYGLADSVFRKIRSYLRGGGGVRILHINTATADELKDHPYLRWKLAHAVVDYRNQHGPYRSVDELKNLPAMADSIFIRVRPYLGL